MAKGGREKIKLESSAGTGHFYTTDKNKKTTPEKLEMMKFDPEGTQARDLQGNEVEVAQRHTKKTGRMRDPFSFG